MRRPSLPEHEAAPWRDAQRSLFAERIDACPYAWIMLRGKEERNRRMLRARDAMDRAFSQPLDVPALARVAQSSPAHFSRQFRAVFGETPHRYLQRRRVERAMELLRETDRSVTEICLDAGWVSLGTFSRTFAEIVGESPSAYRARFASGQPALRAPVCWTMAWMRPAA